MKRLLFLLAAITLFVSSSFSQEDSTEFNFKPYGLTVSTGVNNYMGILGLGVYYSPVKQVVLEGSAGFGSTGKKLALNAQLYPSSTDGLYLRAAFCHSTGASKVPLKLELEDGTQAIKDVNFKALNNTHITIGRSWSIIDKHRFFAEIGYSVLFGDKEDMFTVENATISENSKTALRFTIPGGLVFGLGFSYGI